MSMRWFYSSLVLAVLIGCDSGPRLAPVSGKITLDDKPLVDATVGFYPQINHATRDEAPLSSGRTNENGEYKLVTVMTNKPGAVVGKHKVSIVHEPNLPEVDQDAPANKKGKVVRMKVPAKYQGEKSELTCDVPASGKTDANFDLKSK